MLSEGFWQKLSTMLGWLAIGMLFGLITFTSSIEIKDLDLWLHLRMGWWICHHGFVPDYDVLSAAIAGKPWINHEWLFQVLVYQIQDHFGFNGLINMQSVVVSVTFIALLFLGYSRERQGLTLSMLLMVLLVYESRFTIRPDQFSLLFFVLEIYILSLHLNKRWAMYALVIIQVLWSNTHGFFFFGPLLVGIGIFSEFIKRRLPLPWEWNTVGRLTDEEYTFLKKIFLLFLLCCCVNPSTISGALYPLRVFFSLAGDNKIFFEHIVELQRPITAQNIFTDAYCWYKVLILISALSFIYNRRRLDISSFFMWLVFLFFSLAAIRNIVFFAVAAYMVSMLNAISLTWENIVPLRFSSAKFRYLTMIVFKGGLIFWMMNYALGMTTNGYFDYDTYTRKSEFLGVSKRVYPYKAVDFLIQQKIRGNFFNDFNSGAYLIGRVYPNIKVFIDGRTEVYGADFFQNYQKIWPDGDAHAFKYFENKYDLTGALLNNAHQQIPVNTLKMFHAFKNWSIVYLDYDGVIFLKQTPYNQPFIDHFGIDLNQWKPKSMDLIRIGTKRIDPFPFTNRAFILENLGADEAALNESKEALKVSPDDGAAYGMIGKIYAKRHDNKKAMENYRLAVLFGNNDMWARLGLAQSYEHLKYYNAAIEQYQRVRDSFPKSAQAYFGLARTYALSSQFPQALGMLNNAAKFGFQDRVAVKKIHDIINNVKNPKVIKNSNLKRK